MMKENNLSKPSNVFLVLLVVIVAIVLVNTYSSAPDVPASSGQSSDSSKKDCDAVADTFFMNFHSNMNDTAFYNERGTNKNLVAGCNKIVYSGKELSFTVQPSFNTSGCLDYIRLEGEIQFGDTPAIDKFEVDFANYILGVLKTEYNGYHLNSDSTARDIHILSQLGEWALVVGAETNCPSWVFKHAYLGRNDLPDGKEKFIIQDDATDHENRSNDSKSLELYPKDKLYAANWKSYSFAGRKVSFDVFTSSYNHQKDSDSQIQKSSRIRLVLVYSSSRYTNQQASQEEEKQKKESESQGHIDSLERTNNQRL